MSRLRAMAGLLGVLVLVIGTVLVSGDAAGATALRWSPVPVQVTWDERGSLVLTPAEAVDVLALLPEDSPAPVSWVQGGSRTGWFGESWQDVDGDGCDTRNEILARDLSEVDFSRDEGVQDLAQGAGQGVLTCPRATVFSGLLADPYTGSQITFTRGQDTSSLVQIDHVVALNYLYAHGAWAWDARTRLLVANDPLNLLAVDGQTNTDKGACGPATCPVGSTETGSWDTGAGPGWWPPADGYRCQYAVRFVSVLSAYQLGVPEEDREALTAVLSDCATGGDGQPGAVDRARPVVREATQVLTRHPGYTVLGAVGALLLGASAAVRARHMLAARRERRRRR